MCHVLLVMPLLALPLFFFLPFGQALLYYGLILLVCAIVYGLMVKDMRRPASTGVEGMVGGVGRVIGKGSGDVKVAYRGEIWDALSEEEVSVGDAVQITGLKRMKLSVRKPGGPKPNSVSLSSMKRGG